MNLEKRIDDATRIKVEDDPRVVQARQRLKDFKARKETLSTSLTNMAADATNIENESAAAMLAGRPTDVKQLTALATKRSEVEAEVRILQSVIENATSQMAEIQSQVRREADLAQWKVVAAVLEEFTESIQPVIEKRMILEKALGMRVAPTIAHHLRMPLYDFQNFSQAVSDAQDIALSMIQKLSAK